MVLLTIRQIVALSSFLILVNGQEKHNNSEPIIGIDLGTTYSCVGIINKDNRIEIFPNEFGNRITPSYVAFTDEEKLVGEAAKNQAHLNPKRTIHVVKRLMGKKFDDPEVQRDMKWVPYDIVKGENGKAMISIIQGDGRTKLISPEEISAMILAKMKEIAENALGHSIKYAVVTVPAYFNDGQRQATIDAGKIAGLEVLRIVNEPTAAALGYKFTQQQGDSNIVVYDLGGGTFDVSLLKISNNGKEVEVKRTSGDTHLGGEDFDQILCEHFIKIFKKKQNKDISSDTRALQLLKTEVEKAKRDLSYHLQAKISIENLIDGIDFLESITRARFEELCGELFKKTIQPVQQVLEESKMKKSDIHEILLVGGSTRIPKIQQLITNFFDGKEPSKRGVNPDEAVAQGAAVQGNMLNGGNSDQSSSIILIDVTPMSLGIEVSGKKMSVIIPRGTIIPAKLTQIYTTLEDYQIAVTLRVFEGENSYTRDNKRLGEFDLNGIEVALKHVPKIHVTFDIDNNNMLSVTAIDSKTGRSKSVTIKRDNGELDVEKIIEENLKNADKDKAVKDKYEARLLLEQYIEKVKDAISIEGKLAEFIDSRDKSKIKLIVSDSEEWIEFNRDEGTKEEFERQLKLVMKFCNPLLTKAQKKYSDQKYSDEFIEDL